MGTFPRGEERLKCTSLLEIAGVYGSLGDNTSAGGNRRSLEIRQGQRLT
jgi:hypothetical protein